MKATKITALVISIILIVTLFAACSADSITLNEPKYNGEAPNGKPEFKLSWSQVADTQSYQLVFYAEGDGFAIRTTKNIFNTTEANIVFLQGVYTDTVKYRIKVGPLPTVGEDAPFYSNIYEVNFINGIYTISQTNEDFDQEIIGNETETTIVSDTPIQSDANQKEPFHDYPESFMDFMEAEENSDLSLDDIASVNVNVNYDSYGEPTQFITDESTITKLKSALAYMTVTDKADEQTGSQATYYNYTFNDSKGKRLFSFIIQGEYLVSNFGRYNVDGLPMLLDNSGIMLERDWQLYWDEYNQKITDYAASNNLSLPMPVLSACGYATNELANTDPSSINSINCYVDWNDQAGKLYTTNTDEITSIMNALKNVSATQLNTNPKGQMWHITFTYSVPGQNFLSNAYLEFKGDCIKIGNNYYSTSGLEQLFSSAASDIMNYLANHRTEEKVDPVY